MRSWKPVWLTRVAVLALVMSVFVGCSDVGPEDVDPVATSNTLDNAVTTYMTANPAVNSLDVFGASIAGAIGAPAPLFAPKLGLGSAGDWAGDVWDGIRDAQVRRTSGPTLMASIPVGLLGKTFVYNAQTAQYEIDVTATGAPANGVRFILYAVDPVVGQPVDPLQAIGHVDIIDTSSFPTISVSLTAVIGTETLLSYSVTGTFSQTGGTLDVSGYVSDGTSQLDFTFALSGNDTSASITVDLSFGNVSVHVSLSEDAVAGTESGSIEISDGDNRILFSVTGDALGNVTGNISFNGTVVAVMGGTFEAPTFSNAEGGALTEAELVGIRDAFNALEEMFVTVEELMALAFLLLGLGAI